MVSGAAYGIDQAAHRGALAAGGATVAVLACGADRVYPAAHRELIDHIAEHTPWSRRRRWARRRPRCASSSRNRLIAALSRGTVLVEAAIRSGALNTAHWADLLSRVLMGVPGPVTSVTSQGVHQQIRNGAASLVTSGLEVLELVGASGEHLLAVPRGPERPHDGFSLREVRVLDAVPVARGASTESISSIAGVGVQEADRVLLALADAGLVHLGIDGWRLVAGGGRREVPPSAALAVAPAPPSLPTYDRPWRNRQQDGEMAPTRAPSRSRWPRCWPTTSGTSPPSET